MAELRQVPLRTDGGRHAQLAKPEGWTAQAKCIGSWDDYDLDIRHAQAAVDLCDGCPVIEQCLAAAMAEEGELSPRNRYGVRGGLTPLGRFQVATANKKCEKCGAVGQWGSNGAFPSRCLHCIRLASHTPQARAKHNEKQAKYRARKRQEKKGVAA